MSDEVPAPVCANCGETGHTAWECYDEAERFRLGAPDPQSMMETIFVVTCTLVAGILALVIYAALRHAGIYTGDGGR